MPFITKDVGGRVVGVFECPQHDGQEFVDSAELDAPAPDYSAMRAQAYRDESDPLFFKSQRGEATAQDWLDKVAEIKARWPE